MLSIQLIGFNQKSHQILTSMLDSALTEEFEALSIDCLKDLFKNSMTGADITILNFAVCQTSFPHCEPPNNQHRIILCVDDDNLPVDKYLETWPIFDVWDIRIINESRVRLSVKNLLNDVESKAQIETLKDELNQNKKLAPEQGYQIGRVSMDQELRDIIKTFHYSPCAVVIVNPDGDIEYINPEFSRVTGYSLDEAIGKNPRILKSGVHDQKFYKQMWDTLLGGEVWRGDICNKTKDGSHFWERVAMVPVKDRNDKIKYFFVVRVDDMERRKAEEAVRKADVLKTVRELAGGIAHEFSQPLQVLTINTQLMENSQEQNQMLDRSVKMIHRISELVNNLKHLTKIEKKDYLDGSILDLKASSHDEKNDKAALKKYKAQSEN